MTVRARIRRVVHGLAVALVGALVLAACGAPAYTYVTNSAEHTYAKVPTSWAQIAPEVLAAAMGVDPSTTDEDRGFWVQGFDAADPPSPVHLLGTNADAPALLVAVQDVPAEQRGSVSLDKMRDFFNPITPSGRQMAELTSAVPLSDFALVTDETLTPGHGLRGVHSVYLYSIAGGPSQVFDQTLYTNDDSSKLYVFYVRCSVDCYKQREREIGMVVASFTVRETP